MNKQANRISPSPSDDDRCQEANDLLHYIERRNGTWRTELEALAQHLYPTVRGRDARLAEASRLAFVTLCGYLYDNHQDENALGFPFARPPTTRAVGRMAAYMATDPEADRRWMLLGMMHRRFLAEWTRSGFSLLLQLSDRRLGLVMQTLSDTLDDVAQRSYDRMH